MAQRATIHRWTDVSHEKSARPIAVLLFAERLKVNGHPIEEIHVAWSGALKPDGTRY